MMHLVYSSSVCNIAASAADGPHESLFRDRDQKHIEAGMVEASFFSMDNVKRAHVVTERNYCERQLRGPLNHRGWVMQERFLAPRVLYFGSDQVVWECLTENASEVFPLGRPGSSPVKRINALWNFVGPQPAAGTASMSDELLSAWTSVIKEYASCELTYPTDKIFAMTGVAQVFAEISGDVFVAGMWKTRMASMFDWWITEGGLMNPTPATRLAKPVAPSFSWASVDGLLVLFRQSGYEDLLETLEVIMPSDNQLASLRMRGRLFIMARNSRFAPCPGKVQTEPEYILSSSLQGDWGTDCEVPAPHTRFIAWDTNGDVPSDDEVVIVLSRRKLPQHLSGIFLVRCSSDEAEHKYRRVGYADIRCDDDQFEKLLEVEPTDFIWI
ncbi:hypothetical protein F5X68DRAFT_244126 [Plectosphaerella plurivora]|uniref:Heterokaryon incompatibility domain-containing protein n=1 Tax=Plectosphaerella plurivora TaxID=936078 RepID=A0A9P8VL13_9PEZI|nr:hypothetical protein F5X68DRAFT_244126 [Plectosphaerella plurivora]